MRYPDLHMIIDGEKISAGHRATHRVVNPATGETLGELPLALEVRLAGDAGRPVAADDGPAAEAYARIARGLIAQGVA